MSESYETKYLKYKSRYKQVIGLDTQRSGAGRGLDPYSRAADAEANLLPVGDRRGRGPGAIRVLAGCSADRCSSARGYRPGAGQVGNAVLRAEFDSGCDCFSQDSKGQLPDDRGTVEGGL